MALAYPTSFVADEIPLWINFKSFGYSSEANLRAQRVGGPTGRTDSTDIWLALPKRMSTQNDINYQEGESPESSLGMHSLRDLAGGAVEGGLNSIGSFLTLGFFDNIATAATEKLGRVDADLTEAIFSGAGLRSFQYSFEMTPKDQQEADNIDKICSEFQRFAYPKAAIERSSKMYHPPLWGIGVFNSISGSRQRQWDMSPQVSVLRQVSIDKTGAGGPYGFGDRNNPSPTTTILTLQYQELEPNVRSPFKGELSSRSVAKTSHGKN
jgi:hypothetical protein